MENRPEALKARIYCHDCGQHYDGLVILGLPEACPCRMQPMLNLNAPSTKED